MRNISRILMSLMMAGFSVSAFALEGSESIVFNPKTGNYLITYLHSPDNTLRQVIFIPATKFKPTFKNKFILEKDGAIHFEYTLISGRASQQLIVGALLAPVSSVVKHLSDIITLDAQIETEMGDLINKAKIFDTPPAPWETSMNLSDGGQTYRFHLSYKYKTNKITKTSGLTPGSQVGFGFRSLDLPGITQVKIYGYAPNSQVIPGEEVDDENDNVNSFGHQYIDLVYRKNNVRRPAAVPAIPVPNPFNADILIDRIQTQMHTWIAMQLLDATFSTQLDRYLTAAADAYRLNQPKAGKEHIQTLRKMLKKEHEDADSEDDKEDGKSEGKNDDKTKQVLIGRLAARVLDFDLKYVLKRMGDD